MHAIDDFRTLAALDLNLLTALHALLQTHSVTAAAARIGRTQSATSHALSRLRDALGDPLLVRAGRGLVPTPRALALTEPVARAVHAVSAVFERPVAFEPSTSTRRLRVAVPDLAVGLLPGLLAQVGAQAPGVRLEVLRPGPGWDSALASGGLDLVLGSASAHSRPDLLQEGFGPVHFAVVGRRGHPVQSLDLDAWQRWPHVLVQTGDGGRNQLQDVLDARGIHRTVALTVPGFLAALHVVAQTDLWFSTLREFVPPGLADALGLRVHAHPVPLPALQVVQCWHARSSEDPAHAWLRGLVRSQVHRLRGDAS